MNKLTAFLLSGILVFGAAACKVTINQSPNDTALERSDSDLAREIRSKLDVNLPASSLSVKSEKGIVTISGTVPTQQQLARIESLANEIKGVQGVSVQATVAPAKPNQGN